jgi:hypothetical protein
MIVYLSFLFVLFSILGLAFSPDLFSRPFCVMEMVLFLIFGGLFLRHKIKRNGLICFDTFFIPTYLLINYVHAVFIYPDDQYLPAFAFATHSEVIPHALAVAQLGIAMYMLASVMFERSGTVKKNIKIWIPQMAVNRTAYVSVLAGLGVFAFVFLTNQVQGFTHIYPRLMAMIMSLIGLSWYYHAQLLQDGERGIRTLLKKNKLNILATSLFAVSQLYIGGRSEVLLLLFMILLVINAYYVNVKFKVLLPVLVVGMILMGILMITRVSQHSLLDVSLIDSVTYGVKTIMESPNILWMLLTDFVVNAKTLYEAIDYSQVYGYLYGQSYIQYLFVFLPMGGSIFTKLMTGLPIEDLTSGYILSNFARSTYGLGTNMIGDLYLNLTIVGVCVMMFLLGLLLTWVEYPKSKYQYFIYLSLFANCVFLVRADIFNWLNFFVFYAIFDWLMRIHVNVDDSEEVVSDKSS